ncbi:MAG: FecR domain-containing protein [Parasphingopyxis sp.]|uniref:FecR domain-containing protein n=1 Tax=Parasphingopyxis sp. TaxID=1920299 RepID=UPI003FA0327B
MPRLRLMPAAMLALATAMPAQADPVPRDAPLSGRVISARGGETATLVPSPTVRRLEVRQNLKAGDVIRTNARGALAIVFADRTQIRLARNSVLRVNAVRRGSPSSVTLRRGRAWGRTPRGGGSNLSVETPAATAGIRGTEWSISADEDQTSLQVFSGEVELFNDRGSVSVGAGEAASALLGRAPTRVALVDPVGREQMLYFLALEDGLDLFAGDAVPGLAEARRGDWAGARAAIDAAGGSQGGAAAGFVDFVVAIRAGEEREIPPLDEDDADSHAVRAYIESYIGELDRALATADAGLVRFPDAARLYEIKARTALLLGDADMASAAIAAALARNPGDAAALALRAEIAADYLGEPYRALADAERAVALDPDRPRSYQTLSDIRLERGAGREAMRAIDAALLLDPANAALHARRALILLDQGRMEDARGASERALELDPSLSVVRSSLAEYHLRTGRLERALDEGLAASADNPAYARPLIQLAETYYRLGDSASAAQQLDAADRLDANSPLIPLARTAIALHRYSADEAIVSAGDALDRFRARGGVYSNLSENRETGSLVSQAFRFLQLEGWGRYYADRVFDSFTPSSYFDQALNQTPGPFVVRDADGSFNAEAAEDLDQLSSFLQGIALDPLSVANSERQLLFGNGNFFEAELGASYLTEDLRERIIARGSLNGIVSAPFPIGFNVNAGYTDFRDARQRPELDFFSLGDGGEDLAIEAFVGFEPGPHDQFAINLTYERERERAVSEQFAFLSDPASPDPRELERTDARFAFGLWSHEFGYRSRSTIAAGYGTIGETIERYDLSSLGPLPDRITIDEIDFSYLSANYAHSFGFLDVRTGVEFADITVRDRSFPFNADIPATRDTTEVPNINLEVRELRGHVDLRYRAADWLILQGQAELVNVRLTDRIEGGGTLFTNERTRFNWRLGGAIEPVVGQWLRFATLRETESLFPLSFRPVNVIGLKANIAPAAALSRSRSHIARWDAQWSERLFTTIEYQDQRFAAVDYKIPDLRIDAEGGPVTVRRLGAELNWWPGANIGLRAAYAYTDSAIRGSFVTGDNAPQALGGGFGCDTADIDRFECQFEDGDRLPFVPGHVGRASLIWALPAPVRLRTILAANYVGGQRDDIRRSLEDYATVDLRVEWEPMDRRFLLSLAALNLFDNDYMSATDVPAPGITLLLSAAVRF